MRLESTDSFALITEHNDLGKIFSEISLQYADVSSFAGVVMVVLLPISGARFLGDNELFMRLCSKMTGSFGRWRETTSELAMSHYQIDNDSRAVIESRALIILSLHSIIYANNETSSDDSSHPLA